MALTVEKIFYFYIAVVGVLAGLLLVQVAAARDFFITPFFWIMVAIGLFEIGNAFVPRGDRAVTLTNLARIAGLCIGLAAMWAVTASAGVPVRLI